MKKLLKYMKGFGKQCILGPLFKLLEASFELMIPLVVARIVDTGIANGDQRYVVKMCGVMIALGISIFPRWLLWVFPPGCAMRCWTTSWGLATARSIGWVPLPW